MEKLNPAKISAMLKITMWHQFPNDGKHDLLGFSSPFGSSYETLFVIVEILPSDSISGGGGTFSRVLCLEITTTERSHLDSGLGGIVLIVKAFNSILSLKVY